MAQTCAPICDLEHDGLGQADHRVNVQDDFFLEQDVGSLARLHQHVPLRLDQPVALRDLLWPLADVLFILMKILF